MLGKCELLFNSFQDPPLSILLIVFFEDLESNNERNASISLSLPLLGNIFIISKKTRINLSGKLLLFILSIRSNKCDLSFIIFGRFDVKVGKCSLQIWITSQL